MRYKSTHALRAIQSFIVSALLVCLENASKIFARRAPHESSVGMCVHTATQACSRFHLHRSVQHKGHRFDYLFIYLFESEPPHMIPWKPYASISAIETFPLCWATQRSESKTTSVFSADDFSVHISIVGPFIFVIPLFRCLRWQHTWALYMGSSDIASRLTGQFLSVEQK